MRSTTAQNIVLSDADMPALRTRYDAILSVGERPHRARFKPGGKAGRVKQSFTFIFRLGH